VKPSTGTFEELAMKLFIILSIAFQIATAIPASAQAPAFVGKWYSPGKVEECINPHSDGILTFTPNKYQGGQELHCNVKVTALGANRWKLNHRCSSEGERTAFSEIVEVNGDRMKRTFRGGKLEFATRCARMSPQEFHDKMVEKNRRDKAAGPPPDKAYVATNAAALKNWAKGKPIVRQSAANNVWAVRGEGTWSMDARVAEAMAAGGFATLTGRATEAGATLIMK
jgi:hypothetical protein